MKPARPPTGWRRGSRKVPRIILILVLVLVGTVAAAETYYRHRIADCIATQVEQDLGSKVSVSLGPKPLLFTAIDHHVQYVDLNSDDATFGPAVDMKVHARLNDISLIDNGRGGADIGSSSAEATWSNEGIAQTMKGLISGVRSDSSTGVLDFEVFGGIADLQVKPQIVGDHIEVITQSAQLFGLGLPTDLVDGIVDLMTESLQNDPLNLKPTEVRVTDNSIEIRMVGGPTKLELQQNTEAYTC